MKKDLLLLLADKLETIPREKFSMGLWMGSYDAVPHDDVAYDDDASEDNEIFRSLEATKLFDAEYHDYQRTIVEPLECKTAGCAMGWASTMPEFQALGLILYVYDDTSRDANVGILKDGQITETDLETASILFDIPLNMAENLFFPSAYYQFDEDPSPQQVAARIRKVVADHSKE